MGMVTELRKQDLQELPAEVSPGAEPGDQVLSLQKT